MQPGTGLWIHLGTFGNREILLWIGEKMAKDKTCEKLKMSPYLAGWLLIYSGQAMTHPWTELFKGQGKGTCKTKLLFPPQLCH